MNNVTQELLLSLTSRKLTMVEQLHEYCAINSGTSNLDGLRVMHQTLSRSFKPLADTIETLTFPPIASVDMNGDLINQPCGDALFIRKRPDLSKRVLLAGHMDTVFAVNHPFQSLKYLNENCLNGPGVADMKGGLIVIQHALELFEASENANNIGWDLLINADEETGSPASGSLFAGIAGNYQAALVYEPAMNQEGTLAKNRKGSGKLTIVATGKAAHAGRAFAEGRNAIAYLAEAIMAIHALNGKKEGVTINIGKVAGGEALNVVPAKAVVKLDIRIAEPEDQSWVMAEINHIIERLQRKEYSLTVHGGFGRPVKRVCQGTQRLFHRIQEVGQLLGLTLDWQDSGGCCDGNNLAAKGLPVIDTLGVRGGAIHSSDEFILLDSLVERSALSALLLADLAQGGLEDLRK